MEFDKINWPALPSEQAKVDAKKMARDLMPCNWRTFREYCVAANIPPADLGAMKLSFFIGAYAMLQFVDEIHGKPAAYGVGGPILEEGVRESVEDWMAVLSEGMPVMYCPKCGEPLIDWDGFGVLYHGACGYCVHATLDGDVCAACGKRIPPKEEVINGNG